MQKPEMPSENEIQKDGLTDFVGAVTDGTYGAVAFDFKSPHDPLQARKSWFFFDKEYVCLGAGISARRNLPVVTTLNQCLLDGEVTVMASDKRSVKARGDHKLDNARWLFHNGVGYIFPEQADVRLSNQNQSGTWYDINRQTSTSRETITLPMFKLWVDHGNRPQNGSYQYIVVPGTTLDDMAKSQNNRNIEILSNTADIQAVRHAGLGICQAVFYRTGEIQVSGNLKLVADHPGIVMVKHDGARIREISVADPNRSMGRFHFSVSEKIEKSGENFRASWCDVEKMSHITVDLPKSEYAGQSVTVAF
jgi:chondroitin AC lyase